MNEPARPTAARSVSTPPGPIVHVPHTSGREPAGSCVSSSVPTPLQKGRNGTHNSLLRAIASSNLTRVETHPCRPTAEHLPCATRSRVPRSQRLRRRRFAPPTRSEHLHGCSRLSPSLTASHPRVRSTGNASAAAAAPVGLAVPPPTPTPAYGTHCPPMAACAASAFGASASGASGFAAFSVPPDFGSYAECAFPSPSFRFCSLLSARCLPNRLARVRRG